MATYPGAVFSPRGLENKSGVVYDADQKTIFFAEDMEKTNDEVIAIETELGANPKATYGSVAARLADFESRIAALE